MTRCLPCCASAVLLAGCLAAPCHAIEISPTAEQMQAALEKGKEAARQHSPPDTFYTRFGATDDLHPSGFLLTKLGALSVLATHMALRGAEPSESDIAQVLDAKTMLVTTTVFGNVPNFAADSYMVLDQSGRTIKPVTVRFDGMANRSSAWPDSPRFKAKVVASFNYVDLDPKAPTVVTVFPANGGEVTFQLDFAQIP
ncbi:MAG TPA: hypothetical protein VFS39_03575 [Nitrospira sp.]|nr:hypothetical protein [Nitrospira sp.]